MAPGDADAQVRNAGRVVGWTVGSNRDGAFRVVRGVLCGCGARQDAGKFWIEVGGSEHFVLFLKLAACLKLEWCCVLRGGFSV